MAARIAVTGANSAVGRALLRLRAPDLPAGTEFVACVRSARAEGELPDLPARSEAARVSYDDGASLAQAFAGSDAVVHLPGVLIERPGSSYEQANVETTQAVVAACEKAGARKLVLVSAVGADPRSGNRYYRSKGEAEQLVRESGLAHTILRAPLVLGPGTEGQTAILRYARAGSARLPGGGRHLQQPLWIADLARAVLRACDPDLAPDATLDLVGPDVLPECEIVLRLARALGRDVRIRSLPVGLLRFGAALRTRLRGPGFSPDAVDVITADTNLPASAAAELGIELTDIDEMIRRSAETA